MTKKDIALTHDGSHVIVDFTSGKNIIQLSLDAERLNDLINELAWVRRSMSEQQPISRTEKDSKKGVPLPSWECSGLDGEQRVLAFRHPGFGWLPFVLRQSEAELLAKALLALSASSSAW